MLMAFLSVLGLFYGLIGRLLYSAPPGWSSLIMAVFFIGGVQLIMLSLVGSYVGRIYTEVQNRPLYVVKEESGSSPTR
jgi:dolichol-phosphate mannosyltransferase